MIPTRQPHQHAGRGRLLLLFFLLVLSSFANPAHAAGGGAVLQKASLMPLWSPQAQFAGYYVALDKGLYAQHGIDLRILPAGPGHSPAQALRDGQADFAILWLTTALQQNAAGTKLVNLGQIIPRSSMMLISKKSSGIATVASMAGKKVGLWGGDLSIPPRTLFAKYNIQVQEVPLSHTVNLFLRGGIDVTSAMWFNEFHTILNSGIEREELNIITLNDEGMNFPEDGLYALQATVERDPALADAFVAASLAGWQYAFAHPEEAVDIVLKYMRQAKLPANRVHQRWMLDRMNDLLAEHPGGRPGRLDKDDYESVGNALRRTGLIRTYPEYQVFSRSANVRQ